MNGVSLIEQIQTPNKPDGTFVQKLGRVLKINVAQVR